MKMTLFASALMLGTAAMAQNAAPAQSPPADATMPAPAAAPAPDATTPPPAPDAMAAPAAAPAAPDTSAAPAAATDDSSLPMCSKTVTDKCKQGSKGGAHHAAKHHAKKK
jgi:hypothetical protein